MFDIRELRLNDLFPDLLRHFNRYQEVKRCLRSENGKWVLKDIAFVEQWDEAIKKEIVADDFTNCINSGGAVWGVFDEKNELIAFASLLSDFFGSEGQYLQLMQIHTSYEYRSKGIGKILFQICVERAKGMGAKKLYISTHSSEESQLFYEKIGCVDAQEINKKLAEHEPYDRQMEFVL
jgi:ribosomal protein S18 acetylase RimI-like enzyme